MEQSGTPYWQYAALAVIIVSFASGSIVDSRIGILPAFVVSAIAVILMASVWTLGWRTRSGFWRAAAGIAVAVIYAYACYTITGHWPTRDWPI